MRNRGGTGDDPVPLLAGGRFASLWSGARRNAIGFDMTDDPAISRLLSAALQEVETRDGGSVPDLSSQAEGQ